MSTDEQAIFNLQSWKFSASRLGCLESGQNIDFKPLTIVCGPNNTGKTWVMYALYGFLSSTPLGHLPETESLIEDLMKEGQVSWDMEAWLKQYSKKILESIHNATKHRLPRIFNAPKTLFSHSHFDWLIEEEHLVSSAIERKMDFSLVLGLEKNEVLRLVKQPNDRTVQITLRAQRFPDIEFILCDAVVSHLIGVTSRRSVFLMPAERNGLHLFYKELANRRTALLHHATKKDKEFEISALIRDVWGSRYAEPIAHYIDWLNEIPDTRKRKGGQFHALAEEVKKVVCGKYEVDADGNIYFTPKKLKGGDPQRLDLHLSSSTVKSLFGLWFYLEHQAKSGDVLMIDEPELNLHPGNQRKLARLLAKLVNSGLRVVVSTHSDYLVREINSLIMLSQPNRNRDKLMKRFDYQETEVLQPDKVAAYLFDDRKISSMKITKEEGIQAETFDKVIHDLNETSDEIYYSYRGESDSEESSQ